MKVKIEIDPSLTEPIVVINTPELTPDINELIQFIQKEQTPFIVGKNGDMQHILQPKEIHYFVAEGNVVKAMTVSGFVQVKEKLYELENTLPAQQFIRISKSVIANIYEMSKFEASFNGTLCVHFKSGAKEYVSRSYVSAIKELLKMKRRD